MFAKIKNSILLQNPLLGRIGPNPYGAATGHAPVEPTTERLEPKETKKERIALPSPQGCPPHWGEGRAMGGQCEGTLC